MGDVAVTADGLAKSYRLGEFQKYKTLRDTIATTVLAPGRLLTRRSSSPPTNLIWALKDASFEIYRGEAVGVIGSNGAGKSTLLKIMSRITEPTKGHARLHGRVGSLLEVGTGFHTELTGRENVYLNGAILGMTKAEISSKFDDIVAFAGVERFIDTPVKFYSSGMFVRLAFAVAAHMEPEILIVDEVLAVGDAAFQKQCMGKMGEVAREGRTVFFVSHNMQAVSQLTQRCLVLENGVCVQDGPTSEAVARYFSAGTAPKQYEASPGRQGNYVLSAEVKTSDTGNVHRWGQPFTLEFVLQVNEPTPTLCFSVKIVNRLQQPVCHFWKLDDAPYRHSSGRYVLRCSIDTFRLYMGSYTLTTYLSDRRSNQMIENLEEICPFEVVMYDIPRPEYEWRADDCMYLEDSSWSVAAVDDLGQEPESP